MSDVEVRKIKPIWKVILIMIFCGWWKVDRIGIHNLFGPGYWSWGKFRMCGLKARGYVIGKMFYADIWDYQLFFTEGI